MQETWVQSLGWEDPLEKGTAIHSSIVAWRIPRTLPRGSTELDTLSDFRFTSYLKVCCCGTSRTVSSFPHHSETCCGVTGRAEDTRRDTCARGRGPKPGPFVALHPRTLASVLTPWPTARLARAEPPPGLPQVGLVLGSFRLFNAVVNGIACKFFLPALLLLV